MFRQSFKDRVRCYISEVGRVKVSFRVNQAPFRQKINTFTFKKLKLVNRLLSFRRDGEIGAFGQQARAGHSGPVAGSGQVHPAVPRQLRVGSPRRRLPHRSRPEQCHVRVRQEGQIRRSRVT